MKYNIIHTVLPDQVCALVTRKEHTGNIVFTVRSRLLEKLGPLVLAENRSPSDPSRIGVVCVLVLEFLTYFNDDNSGALKSI